MQCANSSSQHCNQFASLATKRSVIHNTLRIDGIARPFRVSLQEGGSIESNGCGSLGGQSGLTPVLWTGEYYRSSDLMWILLVLASTFVRAPCGARTFVPAHSSDTPARAGLVKIGRRAYVSIRRDIWSGKRLASFARKARPYRRSLVGSDGQHRLSPGSCGATPPPEAAAWSIARRQRNGTPSELLAVQSRRSLRSMRHCKPMWRNGWLARSSLRAGLLFPARPCPGMAVGMDPARPAVGKRWSPEQIARRLPIDFPEDETMRISHEAIYQALFVQGRGALRRELTACLRTGRALRMPQGAHARARQDLHLSRDHDQSTSGGGSRSRRAGPLGRRPHLGSW